ncbi:MAG: MG2 domain-containing protein [Blastocatellia bacterium]|nr:MG2 domain-containing protein [Blastocatellia bacterium]
MITAHLWRRTIILFAVSSLSLTLALAHLAAPGPPSVREDRMRADLSRDSVTITLPIHQPGASVIGKLAIALLDETGKTVAENSAHIKLLDGDNLPSLRLSWPEFAEADDWEDRFDMILWSRVYYRFVAEEGDYSGREIAGVRALGLMVKELFALRIIAPYEPAVPAPGSPLHIRVFAENPMTGVPVRGVRITAALYPESVDEADRIKISFLARHSITKTGETGADGSLSWDFDELPPPVSKDDDETEYTLKLTGLRGIITVEQEREIEFQRATYCVITTDKGLYQPGQILHVRLLAYDSHSRRPRKSEALTIRITDQENETAFEREVTTDRFGVAAADWQIPPTTPLGQYTIEVRGNNDDPSGQASVRVSRYELPTFVTEVEPDRAFYLPGQDAKVKVTARFVYGEPVKSGRVRIARESSREWNFEEQRWQVEEEGVWEGEADSEGAFAATIPLADEHEELKETDGSKYDDPEYVARYTETASGRSEEKRFRLRVTKEAIHVYAFSTEARQTPKLPIRLYVIANYADGTPAIADISVKAFIEATEETDVQKQNPSAYPIAFQAQARTDLHGVALIEATSLLKDTEGLKLKVSARDEKGAMGNAEEDLPLSEGDAIRLKTDRALYHRGDALRVDILSTAANIPRLQVEILSDGRIIRAQMVSVQNGRASLELAPGHDLAGRITIVAYDPDEEAEYIHNRSRFATRTVLFPRRRVLDLTARFDRDSVKPGEAARVRFTSIAPDGRPRETSLGVVIYDAAVEERERTESESGQGYDRFGECYARFFDWYASLSDVTLRDLEQLDESKSFPASLELVAEALLQRATGLHYFRSYSSRVGGDEIRSQFDATLNPLRGTLDYILSRHSSSNYPRNEERLYATLALHGFHLDKISDPWGNPYRPRFGIRREKYETRISSDGPDEEPGTRDDFDLTLHSRPFFEPAYEKQVQSAFDAFKSRQGRYPAKADELLGELRARYSNLPQASDPWGTPYEFLIEPSRHRSSYEVAVRSAGPDRKFDRGRYSDDVTVAGFKRDWFADMREAIRRALYGRSAGTQQYPRNEEELLTALKEDGIDFSSLRDPWGQPLTVIFHEAAYYADRVRIESVAATPSSPAVNKTIVEPVTRTLLVIRIGVYAAPEATGYSQPVEFHIVSYHQVIREESRSEAAAIDKPAPPSPTRQQKAMPAGLAGAVRGIVTDSLGAVVANTTITLTDKATGVARVVTTDETGFYVFINVKPGTYALRADTPGFKASIIENLDVRLSSTTIVDVVLEVGSVSEAVMITSSEESVQTAMASATIEGRNLLELVRLQPGAVRPNAASTPRLRQDFPETLVWQPSLITNSSGKAELRFKAADSITTWRMAVFGSTEDGLIGSTTADLRAFQPFFVEHLPPPSLTIGDEIETPVVVRNYQERAADVKVKLAPAPWMQVLGSAEQTLRAQANDSTTARILFKAVAAGEFKQEASAIGAEEGDRVARPISVRFDGRDTWRTYADLFQRETSIDLHIPEDAIPGSSNIELKVYPDLFAHALEGIQGIVRRPYGCLEQTTSAGYANLIVLQYLKRTGRSKPSIEEQATRNLADAIARIRSYASGGGYSYFGGSGPDIAVTSYVLRFLTEAREFAPIDESLIEATQRYLAREQLVTGAWPLPTRFSHDPARVEMPRLAALVARALAASRPKALTSTSTSSTVGDPQKALDRALDYLAKAAREYDDPYTLALYVIAAREAGRADAVAPAARALARLAQTEAGALFWDVKANTPFYGWGRAGRMETTGLAVEALAASLAHAPVGDKEAIDRATRRGLLFLVKNKDEYGVWYSTQATVNVLRALVAVAATADAERRTSLKLEVSLDGSRPVPVEIAAGAGGPAYFDLSKLLPRLTSATSPHRVTLRTGDERMLGVGLVARETVPWRESDGRGVSEDGGLRLRVSFDRTDVKQGEEINCTVYVERVGARGYGMMLAEIGLPPGVDVDMASLKRATVSQFDATPDRVVFYLWPQAGGTRFSFSFRPRLKINAAAQPSVLYDYYNPDARVSIAPARFTVR